MKAPNSPKQRRSRSRALLATLVATIALVGVEQALVSAPAGAVMQEGEECLYTPWLAECEEENGGGGAGGGGGWGETHIGAGGGGSTDEETQYEREHRAEINELDRELEKDTTRENAEDRERSAREIMERLSQEEAGYIETKKKWLVENRRRLSEIACSDRLAEAYRAQQESKPALADSKIEDFQACTEIEVRRSLPTRLDDPCSSLRDKYGSAKQTGQTGLMDQALGDLNFCTAKYALWEKEWACDAIGAKVDDAAKMYAPILLLAEEYVACLGSEKEMRKNLLERAKKRIKRREFAQRRK